MKEMYDLWVEAAEIGYAKAAWFGIHAGAGGAGQRCQPARTAQRELLEEWSRQFDSPTRAELNTLHQQVRELEGGVAEARRLIDGGAGESPQVLDELRSCSANWRPSERCRRGCRGAVRLFRKEAVYAENKLTLYRYARWRRD
jgi:hypothetical protein